MRAYTLLFVTIFTVAQPIFAKEKSPLAPQGFEFAITEFMNSYTLDLKPGFLVPKIEFQGCLDCAIAWGVRHLYADGTTEDEPGVFKEDGVLAFGSSIWASGVTSSMIVPTSTDPTVVRTCIYDLQICPQRDNPASCKPLGSMYYEFDEKTGAAATSIPMKKGLALPPGSEKFEPRLCTDQVS